MIYNADCLDILKTIGSETIDCVVTDCPYHIISGGCTNDAVKIGRYREVSGVISHRLDNAKSEEEKKSNTEYPTGKDI